MQTRSNLVWFIVAILVSVVIWALLGMALAQEQSVPKSQDKLALGEPEVKQLLLLMDTDKNGKVSKEEWMQFMEAEFDRLDKDKKRAVGCQGTKAIEIAGKPSRECGEGRTLRARQRAAWGSRSAGSVFVP